MRRSRSALALLLVIAAAVGPVGAVERPGLEVRPDGTRTLWGVPLAGGLLTKPLCGSPKQIQGLGRVCEAPNGQLQVLFDDGTSALTHGVDPAPVAGHEASAFEGVTKRRPSCVRNPSREYHIQMVYATASDRPDRYTRLYSRIRDMTYMVNGFLYKEGAEFGRPELYRMACSGGHTSIKRVRLQVRHAQVNYGNVVSGVRAAGYTNPLAKYWVFYDGWHEGLPGGTASAIQDDDLAADNMNNFGPSYGAFYGFLGGAGASILMHEASHSLGAVQPGAPRSSGPANGRGGGFHCNDGADVMCYPDGAARSDYRSTVCRAVHFDCGHNDYYNPRPSSRNWLRTHWNLGSPLNRFFAGCTYATGQLTAGAGAGAADGTVDPDARIAGVKKDWAPISARSHGVSSRCRGRSFALSASVVPPAVPANALPYTEFANGVLGAGAADANVCFYAGSRVLRCYTAAGQDTGTVPSGTTRARVFLNAGANATYVLSIV